MIHAIYISISRYSYQQHILTGAKPEKKFQGQASIQEVYQSPAHTAAIRNIFAFEKTGIYVSNEFEGASERVLMKEDTLIVCITPENTPFNIPALGMPFRSDIPMTVLVKMTYLDAKHRYYLKISSDGEQWQTLDSVRYREFDKGNDDFEVGSLAMTAVMELSVSPGTL